MLLFLEVHLVVITLSSGSNLFSLLVCYLPFHSHVVDKLRGWKCLGIDPFQPFLFRLPRLNDSNSTLRLSNDVLNVFYVIIYTTLINI